MFVYLLVKSIRRSYKTFKFEVPFGNMEKNHCLRDKATYKHIIKPVGIAYSMNVSQSISSNESAIWDKLYVRWKSRQQKKTKIFIVLNHII